MKIEQNPAPSSLIRSSDAKPKGDQNKSEGVNTSPQSIVSDSNHRVRDKTLQWFARAGITSTSSIGIGRDISKQIARHQFVKAQRKMKNLERVLDLALNYSLEQHQPDDVDPDWFFSFIDMAENIHSPAMQELWAKIFSVEVSHPGTFSLRTLETLKKLTQRDAQTLKLAVSLGSRKKNEHGLKILFGYNQKPSMLSILRLAQTHQLNLAQYGLAYPDLLSLMDLGLIYSSEIETGELPVDSRSQYRCAGEIFHLAPKRRGMTLTYYKFTSTGAELAKLVHGKTKTKYLDELKGILSTAFDID